MASATAVLYGVNSFDGRIVRTGAGRRAARFIATNLMLAAAAVTAVGATGVSATLGAAWLLNRSIAGNSHIHASAPIGPASLALVTPAPAKARGTGLAFADKWARTASLIVVPRPIDVPQPKAAPVQVAKIARAVTPARANIIPLPRPMPHDLRRQPVEVAALAPKIATPAPKIVAPPPAIQKPVMEAHNKEPALAETDRRTALYDIAAHTVFMPNGQKLEAHSGLGDKLDDPRFIKVRMRGPTPPNVYQLTLRGEMFHGVRAIRLNPVDEGRMYGRDGMLAHTYMLGPNGQSNGCVSFKDYRQFLTAFLNGEVDRLVVVPALGNTPWRTAVAQHGNLRRYADNN